MSNFKKSTKLKPLLFFETFLNKESLSLFESQFYYPLNLSFKANKKEGYIEYLKDSYKKDEAIKPVRKYYKDNLLIRLKSEMNVSINLLYSRKEEVEYYDDKPDLFLSKQLDIISNLMRKVIDFKRFETTYIVTLEELENKIKKLLKRPSKRIISSSSRKNNKSYFDIKSTTYKRPFLKQLYNASIDLDIFDVEITSQESFLNVFSTPIPSSINDKLQFIVDNQIATHYLKCLNPFFNNLTHSRMAKSQLFYNKNGKQLNQRDLDTALTRLKNNTSNKLESISERINKLISK